MPVTLSRPGILVHASDPEQARNPGLLMDVPGFRSHYPSLQ